MKLLITIALIYYGLKIIGRYAFPYMMRRFMGKMEDKFREQTKGFGNEKPEDINIGETVIQKKPSNKTSNKNVGEYVDYEEVD